MHSLIMTAYQEDKDAIYRVDSNNNKVFYANLHSGDTRVFPERIVFWSDDFHKRSSTPKNTSFLVRQFEKTIKQLHWY